MPPTAITRRNFCLSATAVLVSGCIPAGDGSHADLIWGRYGFSEGRFRTPRAITIDQDDQLYIADKTGRIQVFDCDGNLIRFWSTPQSDNGKPTGLSIQTAEQAADGVPKLLVADTHYYRMLAYTLDGTLIESATIGGVAGHRPGEFAFVTDAISDDDGCFYVGEYNASDRIQKFDPDGKFIAQWGGTGDQPGQFVRPQSLLIHDDVLWITDACNHRIQRFDLSQGVVPELIDVWGGPGELPGQFFYPYDLTLMPDGSVLVVEYKNNRVQHLTSTGEPIGIWGSPGFQPGMLNGPWGVVVDSNDRIHVIDSYNHRVQRLRLSDFRAFRRTNVS
jgi:sugar lactone lactonase YvrE